MNKRKILKKLRARYSYRFLKRVRSQKGLYVVMMAVLLPVILLIGAFIMEFSAFYVLKSKLQNSTDLACLSTAKQFAQEYPYAKKNDMEMVSEVTLRANQSQFKLKRLEFGSFQKGFNFIELHEHHNQRRVNALQVTSESPTGFFMGVFVDLLHGVQKTLKMEPSNWLPDVIEASAICGNCPDGSVKLGGYCPCGDGRIDEDEECDNGLSNGEEPGIPSVSYNRSECLSAQTPAWCTLDCKNGDRRLVQGTCCGDGIRNHPSEQCDGESGCVQCCDTRQGFEWNGTECVKPNPPIDESFCGDGRIDEGEQCESNLPLPNCLPQDCYCDGCSIQCPNPVVDGECKTKVVKHCSTALDGSVILKVKTYWGPDVEGCRSETCCPESGEGKEITMKLQCKPIEGHPNEYGLITPIVDIHLHSACPANYGAMGDPPVYQTWCECRVNYNEQGELITNLPYSYADCVPGGIVPETT